MVINGVGNYEGSNEGYSSPTFSVAPTDPTGSPSGTVDYSNMDMNDLYNMNNTGMINIFTSFLEYIDAHPGSWEAYIDMGKAYAKVYQYYQQMGQPVPQQLVSFLQQSGGDRLIQDGIETGSAFAFKNGYGSSTHEDAYKAYLNSWIGFLQGLPGSGSDPILGPLTTNLSTDVANADQFNSDHYNAATGRYGIQDPNSGQWLYFDTDTSTDPNIGFAIDSFILFEGTGADLTTLGNNLGLLKSYDLVNTIDAILKGHGAEVAIFLILAFMMGAEGGYMNQVDGNNDVMNQQHELSTRYVQSIQSALSGMGNWNGTTPNDKDGASAHVLREGLVELLGIINVNGTQFGSLDSVVSQLTQYLQNNSVPFPAGSTTGTVTLYDLLIKGTDDSGNAISDDDAALLLKQGLAPNPPSPTAGGEAANPNPQDLQGFIGSITALGTSIDSSSTQLTTLSSQIAQILEALYKVGTSVVDQKNGLQAVSQGAINHYAGN